MNAVVYYSNTSQSKSVAEYLAKELNYPLLDIEKVVLSKYINLVLVFPVHCQNIPMRVKTFLKTVEVDNLTAIATYGKMCYGNVLNEIQDRYHKNIVAGAYIPTKHAYIDDDKAFENFGELKPIVDKVLAPFSVNIPASYKNIFADILTNLRSRLGVRINRNNSCNECGQCTENCSLCAIENGKINNKCIRCLKCVALCPQKALSVKMSQPLRIYLRKKKKEKLIIYV